MKLKIKMLNEKKGMGIIIVVFISAILLITFYALSSRLFESRNTTIKIVRSNKALYLADSGIQLALAQLREDPYLSGTLPADNSVQSVTFTDQYEVGVGTYTVTVSTMTDPSRRLLEVRSVARLTPLNQNQDAFIHTKTVTAVIETDNPGDYAMASNTELQIAGGTTLAGKVYAKKLTFFSTGATINVNSATYTESSNYFDVGYDKTHVQVLNNNPDGLKEPWKGTEKTLPRIDNVKLDYYKSLATQGGGQVISAANGNLNLINGTDIYPPANGSKVYFCEEGDMKIKGTVHGQVIFVSSGTITFQGNVKYDSNVPPLDQFNNPTLGPVTGAGFFSSEDVLIGNNVSDALGKLEINGQIIAPNGEFKATSDVRGSLATSEFTFNGGIIVKNGVNIAGVYSTKRTYTFDPNLSTTPLPHMPYMANIVSWKEE